jgi:hypothetical protein
MQTLTDPTMRRYQYSFDPENELEDYLGAPVAPLGVALPISRHARPEGNRIRKGTAV